MNELIASVKPGIDVAERARLKGVLPGLLKSLQAGMDAVALDAGKWEEVVGTVAGDDTVFIATPSVRHAASLRKKILAVLAA